MNLGGENELQQKKKLLTQNLTHLFKDTPTFPDTEEAFF